MQVLSKRTRQLAPLVITNDPSVIGYGIFKKAHLKCKIKDAAYFYSQTLS